MMNDDWIRLIFNNLETPITDSCILSFMIKTHNIGLIKIFIDLFIENDLNNLMTGSDILHTAIQTRDPNIVQMIIDSCGPNTHWYTLSIAINTVNHQIIKLVLEYIMRECVQTNGK